jgi:2-isopropylmalate synthase
LALNLFTQGVDPNLKLDNLPEIVSIVEECNQIETHCRHPYAGELVFTALSGSHQDAIKKGLDAHKTEARNHWDVPYLPLDPKDIGRTYETTIRINSQSGKSGIAYILEQEYGFKLPKAMQIEFSKVIQKIADQTAREILAEQIWNAFNAEYLEQMQGYQLTKFTYENIMDDEDKVNCQAYLEKNGQETNFTATGNGPINAFAAGLRETNDTTFTLSNYEEHTLSTGSSAQAAAYIALVNDNGQEFYGAGIDSNITRASIKALLSAYNRMNA